MVWSPQVGSNRSLTVAARIRARFGAATVRERSISLMPFYLPVQRPAGAVRAFEIVVGLGRIGHAPGGRVVGDLFADFMRHQAEQHLLHHGSGVIEIAVRLAAGAVGHVIALAFAGIQPFLLEHVAARRAGGAGLFGMPKSGGMPPSIICTTGKPVAVTSALGLAVKPACSAPRPPPPPPRPPCPRSEEHTSELQSL